MKKCIKCNKDKSLNDFYNHPNTFDKKSNKCKECCRKYSRLRESQLRENSEWIIKERERVRSKYYRLNYKDSFKPSYENKKKYIENYKNKYPEKLNARNKTSHIKSKNGYHNHHWSYNDKDILDTIELTIEFHNRIHRYLIYDQKSYYYKTLNGNILDTKQKHLNYINNFN